MESSLRERIRTRANNSCEYCRLQEIFDRLPFQPDHIIAEKHDGPTTLENLAWSCYDCNIYKGPNIAGVDEKNGEVIQLFHPRKDNWAEHFRWHGPKLIGVTPHGRATINVLRINLPRRIVHRRELFQEGVFPPN